MEHDDAELAAARAHWRVGMVTRLPLMAQVEGRQQYVNGLSGVIERIEGDAADVRIYSGPAHTGHDREFPQHRKLAQHVPLTELGVYGLNDHLIAVAEAGKLETGDRDLIERREQAQRQALQLREEERQREAARALTQQQELLERGEFVGSETDEPGVTWSDSNDTPAKPGEGRCFMIATPAGTVQVNITFPRGRGGVNPAWGSEAFGSSISQTGYHSLIGCWRPRPEDFTAPRQAAARLVEELQAKCRGKEAAAKRKRRAPAPRSATAAAAGHTDAAHA